jgi:coenzyme F420-reducing hydrogenase gamma subunit
MRKLRVGWFSFTCSEDSTIIFSELLNEHYFEWIDLIDFKYIKILKSKNSLSELDVAFVEGAISNDKDEAFLKKIRRNAKKVIGVGSCAFSGMPSAQRNNFDEKTLKEIRFLLKKFKHKKKVLPLKEIIKVDDYIKGCPMEGREFVEKLNALLIEFGVK